jgi:hypothetical protein
VRRQADADQLAGKSVEPVTRGLGHGWVARRRHRKSETEEANMATVSVRYFVHDVDAAIAFYSERLGFDVDLHPAPGFELFQPA